MKPATSTYDGWIGRDAYDADGDKVGEITDIYYDDATGRPEWVAVKTGLFGMKRTFVPIHGSQPYGEGDLRLAFDKDMIKDAPRVDPEGHLSPDRGARPVGLLRLRLRRRDVGQGLRLRQGVRPRAGRRRTTTGVGTTPDTVTRSEEELHVAKGHTERKETGKVRLRKYVVTENVKMEVPVTREEVRVTREPVSGNETGRGDGKIRSGEPAR